MPSRWDHLFDLKPVTLLEHLVEEVAKLLAQDLQRWPPPVQEVDLDTGGHFAPLFTEPRPRPSPSVYTEALRLTRWELSHETDAYDDYMRHQRYLERGLGPDDRLALLFLSRWLTEQMHGLGEATEGRVKRKHMHECLDRLERKLRLQQPSA
ncbi:hypothetical protein VZQ01_30470 [Myxococcus faecalis]|jgi:hypothetical protein|uniref:hypothetical protein n=1 Tax=Myxococcus TaxID=32 RepID=UPI001CC0D25D|nr:hypothetical protein [Myxococcus sp. XM-1-1-1]MBZ4410232.1 hypothetical protein [Myxococcus sp. XM-1-1-1]BDT36697.1 hypothetical protein MFMH1_63660 [Myxococcus sp. MH1]